MTYYLFDYGNVAATDNIREKYVISCGREAFNDLIRGGGFEDDIVRVRSGTYFFNNDELYNYLNIVCSPHPEHYVPPKNTVSIYRLIR